MPISLEAMHVRDFEELLTFWARMEGVGLNESDTPENLRAFVERNPGLSIVARQEGRIVGAVLCGHDGRRGYLHHLAVEPEFRQRGLGRRLVEQCLAALSVLGILKCNIFVYSHNERGQAFWKRTGWGGRDDLLVMQHALPLAEWMNSDAGDSSWDSKSDAEKPAPADEEAASETTCDIAYVVEPTLSVSEFIDVLKLSTLAERRPVDDEPTIRAMLRNANVIVTARSNGQLVGVSRAITDFAFCTYLSDLAVDVEFQRRGVGRELMRHTHEAAGLQTTLILLAAPKAETYYPHIGMAQHHSCWTIPRQPATERQQAVEEVCSRGLRPRKSNQ